MRCYREGLHIKGGSIYNIWMENFIHAQQSWSLVEGKLNSLDILHMFKGQ